MRDATNKILEMIDEGLLDARDVAQMCLKYMSEDAVADMAEANEIFFEEEEASYDYIINVGDYDDELDPYCVAFLTREDAIEEAKKLIETKTYEFTEVVYMPVDDEDINEVVWRSWED